MTVLTREKDSACSDQRLYDDAQFAWTRLDVTRAAARQLRAARCGRRVAYRQQKAQTLLGAGRVEEPAHGGDAIGRNAHAPGVFLDGLLVGREVDAVHFVAGYEAMEPLDLGSHFLQDVDRFLRDFPQLGFRQISRARDFAFDNKLGHKPPPLRANASMLMERFQEGWADVQFIQESREIKKTRSPWIFDRFKSR